MSKRRSAILILEGADNSGKSTLALAVGQAVIAEGGDFLYLHGSPWPGTVRQEHVRMTAQARDASADGAVVVLDHFWVAEQLYGREYRGDAAYDPTMIDEVMRHLGALVALCVPSDLVAQVRRHGERRAAGKEHFADSVGIVKRYADLLTQPAPWRPSQVFSRRDDVVRYDMDAVRDVDGKARDLLYIARDRREQAELSWAR